MSNYSCISHYEVAAKISNFGRQLVVMQSRNYIVCLVKQFTDHQVKFLALSLYFNYIVQDFFNDLADLC